MTIDLKKLLTFLGLLIPVVGGLWTGVAYLASMANTAEERRVAIAADERRMLYLSLLIETQTNRITMLSMHEASLSPEQKAELEALRRTRTLNECEHQKAIGLLGADHKCGS